MNGCDDLAGSGSTGQTQSSDAEEFGDGDQRAGLVPDLRLASPAEIIELLSTDSFDRLVGVGESIDVDFKTFYDLDQRKGRRDLIADIASFANEAGGVLVVGARTAKHPIDQREYCSAVVGVRAGSITADRVHALLRQHSFPPVHVDVRSYHGVGVRDVDVEVVVVVVRASADADRPVLVDRMVADDDEQVPNAVGWPTRHGDGTYWEPASRVQQLLSSGRRPAWEPPPAVLESGTALDLDDLLDAKPDWEPWGRLAIAVSPTQPGAIDDFYGEFRAKASQWRGLREVGFNLGIWPYVQFSPQRGDLVCEQKRTWVSVSSHGRVVAAAVASPEFLGWARHQGEAPDVVTQLTINPYPLVEFTAEAIRFAYVLVGPAAGVTRWRVVGRLEHLLDRVPVAFGGVSYRVWLPGDRPALQNEVEARLESGSDWRVDGFRLLEDLLGQAFGVGHDDIPLAEEGRIDPTSWTN